MCVALVSVARNSKIIEAENIFRNLKGENLNKVTFLKHFLFSKEIKSNEMLRQCFIPDHD